ncbi:hypothetical protein HYDPIDRAFT_35118, partial [Hydnomerulius pinastri MD-312]
MKSPQARRKSHAGFASGTFVDEVIEIPDGDEGSDGRSAKAGGRSKCGPTKPSSPVKANFAVKTKSLATAKPKGTSKPYYSRAAPPKTPASARDVREVEAITIDVREESEIMPVMEDDFVMNDAASMDAMEIEEELEVHQPVTTVESSSKPKSNAKGKGKLRKSAPSDEEMCAEENNDAIRHEKGKSNPRTKKRDFSSREPSPAPQSTTFSRPYRSNPKLVRRLDASTARRSQAESEPDLKKEDEGEKQPAQTEERAPSTSKLKTPKNARPKAKHSPLESDPDSDLHALPPHRMTGPTSTPVKSEMKRKPSLKQPVDDGEGDSQDEIYARPTKGKKAKRRKEKRGCKDE